MTDARASAVGAPWLGTLQADWPLVPLRYLVSFLSGGTPDKGNPQFWSGGTIPWVSPKDMKIDRIDDAEDHITESALDGSATQLVPVGSVLVVVRGMILAHTLPVAVTTGPVAINQDIKALVCGPRLLPGFLHAVLVGQAEWLLSLADSSAHGTKKLETEVLQRFEVPCPPLEVQRRIVETLQARATGLYVLTAAKKRVVDLLAEKRRAVIGTAVARGLDPNVKLRDSGVPWLGAIPVHWEVLKFSWCVAIAEGQIDPEDHEYSAWPLIAPNHVESGTGRLLGMESAAEQGAISGKYKCRPGDVIYSKIRPELRKATIAPQSCLCSADMYPLRVSAELLTPEYLLYYLLSDAFSVWAVLESSRVAMPKINRESLVDLRMPVPPFGEQHAIVEHITRETAKLDAASAGTERTVALLKERRTALVAAAVIGQIDTEQQHEQAISARYSHAAARRNKEQSR